MGKKVHDFDFLVKGAPYSHIVEANGFLFVSGMLPIDIERNVMIKDDIKKATEQALGNVKRALTAADSSMEKVVKATVYLRDMADFNAMNEVYRSFFPSRPPARTCVAVREIPSNAPVEIDIIALK